MNSILLVDDDQINNKMLQKKLTKRGYTVTSVFNGTQAIEVLKNNEFDVILLDIMMPDISGTEILKGIRKDYSAFELPVIMVTGKADSIDIVDNLKLGANDYIVKPVNIDVALARINTQMALKELNENNKKNAGLETAHAMVVTYNHEINNPLTIALGMLRKLRRQDVETKTVDELEDALNRVTEIVKKIESLSESAEVVSDSYGQDSRMIKL